MQPQAPADRARHRADTDTPTAHPPPQPTRRPIVPMTAAEAIAMVFVELGLLILLADASGLILIAVGIIGYVYARLTYTPALLSAAGQSRLRDPLTDNAVTAGTHPAAQRSQGRPPTDPGTRL